MLRPTPLEIASGIVVGTEPRRFHTHLASTPRSDRIVPLRALQAAMLPALRRTPCFVSFSGGLDSSFVLAVATGLASEHGLPAPIPCTWRFSGAPCADESQWQERVIAVLQLSVWVKMQADDDLDLVGPVAQRLLQRHGVLHPVNVHSHLPIVELAAGGSLLTGVGGDQILSGWRSGPRRSRPSSLRDVVPSPVRAFVRHRRGDDASPWLHDGPSRSTLAAHLHEIAAEPVSFHRRVAWHSTRRDLAMTCSSLDTLAADHDVLLVNPFVDRRFVASLSQVPGIRSPTSRCEVLGAIAAGAVPAVAYASRTKAHFLEVFLRSPTREFVASWDGSGVDPALVDVPSLRRLWSMWPIPPATAGLVQQAWLSTHRSAIASVADSPGMASPVGVGR